MDNFLNIHKASLKQNLLIVKNDKKKKNSTLKHYSEGKKIRWRFPAVFPYMQWRHIFSINSCAHPPPPINPLDLPIRVYIFKVVFRNLPQKIVLNIQLAWNVVQNVKNYNTKLVLVWIKTKTKSEPSFCGLKTVYHFHTIYSSQGAGLGRFVFITLMQINYLNVTTYILFF